VGIDPQVALAQRDEGRDVLDPIGIKVLQLDLVVIQEPSKEPMGRRHEPALMEVHEQHNVAIG
jgi:hypothetical protein